MTLTRQPMTSPQFQEFQQPLSLARRTTSLESSATPALEDSDHAPSESQVQQQLHTARNSPKNQARFPRHQYRYQNARAMQAHRIKIQERTCVATATYSDTRVRASWVPVSSLIAGFPSDLPD